MNEADHSALAADAAVASDAASESDALIAALRAAGAHRFERLRWHYIEALAKRAAAHRGSARRMLDARLAQALATLKERFDLAQCDARETVADGAARYPHAADELRQRFADGDFKGVRQLMSALQSGEQCAALNALVRRLEHHAPDHADARAAEHAGARPELKTIRNFRNTWSKLSADKQVAQALEQAPRNAGPINSHMLVLRSLALMRDISPDYLNRFMSYADTLLCLDQGEKEKPAPPRKPQAARAAKK